jgi:prepilin signal peptidase PulO-like enzyme (type II secretory pathway)
MSACQDADELSRSVVPVRRRFALDAAFALLGCLAAFQGFGFCAALIVSAWWFLSIAIVRSDLDEFIIPNWTIAGIAVTGLSYALVSTPGSLSNLSALTAAIAPLTGRAVATFLIVAALAWGFKHLAGREGLGFGDVKLAGALALWLGVYQLFVTLEVACFAALGLVSVSYLRNRRSLNGEVVPFGAFLAPAAWLVFVGSYINMASGPWRALIG